jgi:hypothetical protein
VCNGVEIIRVAPGIFGVRKCGHGVLSYHVLENETI